eukprot:TRINITY_DN18747_c0_g1_i1.p1 TRINITY_DN18747_c0_g1~~TRINITY_DN18747_c0_g1_i1.p1  ORF type:complete len:963 (+),score=272.59 TRINITY_DN18747_c0_g1_i1:55-2889(+)
MAGGCAAEGTGVFDGGWREAGGEPDAGASMQKGPMTSSEEEACVACVQEHVHKVQLQLAANLDDAKRLIEDAMWRLREQMLREFKAAAAAETARQEREEVEPARALAAAARSEQRVAAPCFPEPDKGAICNGGSSPPSPNAPKPEEVDAIAPLTEPPAMLPGCLDLPHKLCDPQAAVQHDSTSRDSCGTDAEVFEHFMNEDCSEDDEEARDHHAGIPFGKRRTSTEDREIKKRTTQLLGNVTGGNVGQKRACFADASEMKEKIREAVCKKQYDVADYYHDSGISQRIARHPVFDNFTLLVISFNAIWISFETDNNLSDVLWDAELEFQIMEHFFAVYFTFEWLVRFFAFRRKSDGLKDGWFVFDTALVISMLLDTYIINIVMLLRYGGSTTSKGGINTKALKLVRLVRLTRMARMMKLLRAVPEITILIKGLSVASRSVFFTLCLLTIILYVYSIIFRQLVGTLSSTDSTLEEDYFSSVPKAMSSLLLNGVLPDQAALISACADENIILGMMVLAFILLASLLVMNMLVGILCEVVSVVASVEREEMTVGFVKHRLREMFEHNHVDEDDNDCISKEEFDKLLCNRDAAQIIQEIGVDVLGLVDFSEFIFKEGAELTFVDFMELIMQLRGSNGATVKDIVDLRRYMYVEMSSIRTQVSRIEETMAEAVAKQLASAPCYALGNPMLDLSANKPHDKSVLESVLRSGSSCSLKGFGAGPLNGREARGRQVSTGSNSMRVAGYAAGGVGGAQVQVTGDEDDLEDLVAESLAMGLTEVTVHLNNGEDNYPAALVKLFQQKCATSLQPLFAEGSRDVVKRYKQLPCLTLPAGCRHLQSICVGSLGHFTTVEVARKQIEAGRLVTLNVVGIASSEQDFRKNSGLSADEVSARDAHLVREIQDTIKNPANATIVQSVLLPMLSSSKPDGQQADPPQALAHWLSEDSKPRPGQ